MIELNNTNTIDINSFNDILKSDSFKQQLKCKLKKLIVTDLIYYKQLELQKIDSSTSDLFKYIELVYNFRTNKLELVDLLTLPSDQSLQIEDRANCLLLPIYARTLKDNLLSKFVFNSRLNKLTSLDQVVTKFLTKIKSKFTTSLQKFNLAMINEENVHISNSEVALNKIKIPYWSNKPDNQYTFFPTNMFGFESLQKISRQSIGLITIDESYSEYKQITDNLLSGPDFYPGILIAKNHPDWKQCYDKWNQVQNNYALAQAFSVQDFYDFFQFVRKNYGDDEAERILSDVEHNTDFHDFNTTQLPLTNQAVVINNSKDFAGIVSDLVKKNVKVLLINVQQTTSLTFDNTEVEINPSLKSLLANTKVSMFANGLAKFKNNPNVTIIDKDEFKANYQNLHNYKTVMEFIDRTVSSHLLSRMESQSCFYVF